MSFHVTHLNPFSLRTLVKKLSERKLMNFNSFSQTKGMVKGISVVICRVTEQIPCLGELFCHSAFAKYSRCCVYQAAFKLVIDFSFFPSGSVKR